MRLFCWVLASVKIAHVVRVGTFRFHANTQESFEFRVLIDSPLNWEKGLRKEYEHPLSEDPGWWADHSLDEKWYLLDSTEQNSLLPTFSLQWGKFWHQLCYACVNNCFLTVGSGGQGQLRPPACFLTQLMHLSIHTVWVGDQQVMLDFELHLCGFKPMRNLCL